MLRKLATGAGLVVLALFCIVGLSPILFSPAMASEATQVHVAWGSAVVEAAQYVGLLLAAIIMAALRKLPAQLYAILASLRVEQLLNRAVGFGINAVSGAVADKTLTIDVGLEVTAKALQYAIDHGASWLIDWLGGPDKVAEKIWARLPLDENAAAPNFKDIAADIGLALK